VTFSGSQKYVMHLGAEVASREAHGVCVLVDPDRNTWVDALLYPEPVNRVPQTDNTQRRRWWHWKRETK
jgi:hypothetical protein